LGLERKMDFVLTADEIDCDPDLRFIWWANAITVSFKSRTCRNVCDAGPRSAR